jgi:hypothetical protein
MHVKRDDVEAQRFDAYEGRIADLREWRVAWESMPAHFPPDPSPFAGLPDDRCQCPHLGVVVTGAFRVTYLDGTDEVVRAGEAYSLTPGHFVQTLEPTEVIEFSPREEHERTMAHVAANLSAVDA